jgi:hypothetical protein
MYRTASLFVILFLLLRTADGSQESSPAGMPLEFVTVNTPEDIRFARLKLIRHLGVVQPAEWDRALRAGDVKIAKADLNDDGVPEIFIMIENSLWCGSIGCRGIIVQRIGEHWKEVGSPYFSDAIVMTERIYGYHKLFTGDAIYTFRDGKTYEILDVETGQITR